MSDRRRSRNSRHGGEALSKHHTLQLNPPLQPPKPSTRLHLLLSTIKYRILFLALGSSLPPSSLLFLHLAITPAHTRPRLTTFRLALMNSSEVVVKVEKQTRRHSHKGNRPSIPQTKSCPICFAKFTRNTHLTRHLRTRKYRTSYVSSFAHPPARSRFK